MAFILTADETVMVGFTLIKINLKSTLGSGKMMFLEVDKEHM